MDFIKTLPGYLAKRYKGWRATDYAENCSWFHHLATQGQHPRAMVISCCDSRVSVTALFEADAGEIFLYRNIANLVPPRDDQGRYHGAPAAIEFATETLRVAHLLVVGHSGCGGIRGCHDMCSGHAPQFETPDSLIGNWLNLLRPAYERTAALTDRAERLAAMEREGVLLSLQNMMTYDFVRTAVEEERLTVHGLWVDIASGVLEHYDPKQKQFVQV